MLSNLPPGCTGHEPAIAGPDHETQEIRYCEPCDADTAHDVWRYGLQEISECTVCLHESERDLGPDSF